MAIKKQGFELGLKPGSQIQIQIRKKMTLLIVLPSVLTVNILL
jgi:hypothetical protein